MANNPIKPIKVTGENLPQIIAEKNYSDKTLDWLYSKYTSIFDEILDFKEHGHKKVSLGAVAVTLDKGQSYWGASFQGRYGTTDYTRDLSLGVVKDGLTHELKFAELRRDGNRSVTVSVGIGKDDEKIDIASEFGQLIGVPVVPTKIESLAEKTIYPDPEGIRDGQRIMALGVNILKAIQEEV